MTHGGVGRRVARAVLATLVAAVAAVASSGAAPAAAAVSLLQVGTFSEPVYLTAPPGDPSRVFVVEKAGRIQEIHDGTASTFLDLTGRVKSTGSEQGLLSMAFAPDYATSGTFYVYYTAPPASGTTGSDLTIQAFHATDADHGDAASGRLVLMIPHRQFDNHNGGQLQIGPDGLLWIGTGDGGNGNDSLGNAEQTDPSYNDAAAGHDARLGKLLRVDPAPGVGCDGHCTIPAGNAGLGQPEIWAYGLRNPWRFSFDRATGDLVVGDVGQDTWEEVDFAAGSGRGVGADYGWGRYEGLHPTGSTAPAGSPPGITMPVLEKAHADPDGFHSIAGGYVVRDPALPDLAGRYVYADTFVGDIRAVTLAPGTGAATGDTAIGLHVSMLDSFGEDACGRLYAVSLDGPVYRLAQSGDCVLPVPAGGNGAPPPAPPPAPVDRAPIVKLSAASRQRPWNTGVVRLRMSCDEICSVRARGTFLVTRAKNDVGAAAAALDVLHTATTKARLAAGATVTIRLKVSASTRRSLLRSLRRGRRVTLRLAVTATDTTGDVRRSTARSTITRR